MESEIYFPLPEVSNTTMNNITHKLKKSKNIFVFRHHTREPLRGRALTTLQSVQMQVLTRPALTASVEGRDMLFNRKHKLISILASQNYQFEQKFS